MSDALEENTRDKLYIWISETTNRKILWGVNIFFISQRTGDKDGLFIAKVRWPEGKKPCKGNEGVYFGE